jgi:hypothetical protein
MVLICLSVVILSKLAGIMVLIDTIVITKVHAIGQTLQREGNLTVNICKE